MSKLSLQASIRGSKASEQILEQQEGEHVEANADAEDEDEADVNEEIELETEVEEEIEDEPYCPPNPNFIYVLNTDGSEMILNFNCRKTIFFEYIKQKVGLERDCDIDFCDVKGNLQHVSNLQTNDYVTDSFKAMDTYIVCRVTRGKHGVIVSKEPVLDDWEEKYPAMTAHRYSSSANSTVNKWDVTNEDGPVKERDRPLYWLLNIPLAIISYSSHKVTPGYATPRTTTHDNHFISRLLMDRKAKCNKRSLYFPLNGSSLTEKLQVICKSSSRSSNTIQKRL